METPPRITTSVLFAAAAAAAVGIGLASAAPAGADPTDPLIPPILVLDPSQNAERAAIDAGMAEAGAKADAAMDAANREMIMGTLPGIPMPEQVAAPGWLPGIPAPEQVAPQGSLPGIPIPPPDPVRDAIQRFLDTKNQMCVRECIEASCSATRLPDWSLGDNNTAAVLRSTTLPTAAAPAENLTATSHSTLTSQPSARGAWRTGVVMGGQCHPHAIRIGLPPTGRPLNIGEQKRHHPRRSSRSHGIASAHSICPSKPSDVAIAR